MDEQLDMNEVARRRMFESSKSMIVHYYYLRGMKVSEISELLAIPIYTIKDFMSKNDLPLRISERRF